MRRTRKGDGAEIRSRRRNEDSKEGVLGGD